MSNELKMTNAELSVDYHGTLVDYHEFLNVFIRVACYC